MLLYCIICNVTFLSFVYLLWQQKVDKKNENWKIVVFSSIWYSLRKLQKTIDFFQMFRLLTHDNCDSKTLLKIKNRKVNWNVSVHNL